MLLHSIKAITNPALANVTYNITNNSDVNGNVLNFNLSINSAPKRPMFHVKVYLHTKGFNSSGKVFYNRQKDLCYFLTHPLDNRQFMSMYDYLREFSNLPRSCPINENNYWCKDLHMSGGTFPSWFPSAFVTVTVVIYEKGKNETIDYYINAKVYLEIMKE